MAPVVAVVRAAGPEEPRHGVVGRRCAAELRAVAAQQLRKQYDGPGNEPAREFRAHAHDDAVLERRGAEADGLEVAPVRGRHVRLGARLARQPELAEPARDERPARRRRDPGREGRAELDRLREPRGRPRRQVRREAGLVGLPWPANAKTATRLRVDRNSKLMNMRTKRLRRRVSHSSSPTRLGRRPSRRSTAARACGSRSAALMSALSSLSNRSRIVPLPMSVSKVQPYGMPPPLRSPSAV